MLTTAGMASGMRPDACPPVVGHDESSPWSQTAAGCLVILVLILVQLEGFGHLSRTQWLPATVSRKLTHLGSGTVMTTALVLFPHNFWPSRLAVSLSLVVFMFTFPIDPVLKSCTHARKHTRCQ